MKDNKTITEQAQPTDLKRAFGLGCFKEYKWFTPDEGEQPKQLKDGTLVVTGKNKNGETVYFYANGVVKNANTGNEMTWSCSKFSGEPEKPELNDRQKKTIEALIAHDESYTETVPSEVDIKNGVFKRIDLNSLYPTVFTEPGKIFIYKKSGAASKFTEQQSKIIKMFQDLDYTDVQPPATDDNYNKRINVRTYNNGAYKDYFTTDFFMWPKGVTQNVKPASVSDVVARTKQQGTTIKKRDCKDAIMALYNASKNPGITYFKSDADIIYLKNIVRRCNTQGTKFGAGAFGVKDELDYLLADRGRFGLRKESKDMGLKTIIRENIIKTKEEKDRLIQETKIIQNRFLIIAESTKPKTKEDLDKVFVDMLTEMVYLHKQGFNENLIKENVDDVFAILGKLFGGSTNAVVELFKERGVNWIMEKLGLEGNDYLKNFLITALGNTDIKDVPRLFSDCEFLTKKIAESVPEAYLRQLEYEKGMGGDFMDFVRNALYDVIKSSDFAEKIESKISGIICPLVDRMSGKFSDHMGSMRTALIPNNPDIEA